MVNALGSFPSLLGNTFGCLLLSLDHFMDERNLEAQRLSKLKKKSPFLLRSAIDLSRGPHLLVNCSIHQLCGLVCSIEKLSLRNSALSDGFI